MSKDRHYDHKYSFHRESNYSNSKFLNDNKRRNRNRRGINSKNMIIKDRMFNMSTENGVAAGHQFFYESRIDDNIHEDVHSFIDKHMKERKNRKSSYMYEENQSRLSKTNLKQNNRKLSSNQLNEYTQNTSSFISITGNRYESKEDSPPKGDSKSAIHALKLSKARSSELNDVYSRPNKHRISQSMTKNYEGQNAPNRENPYKM